MTPSEVPDELQRLIRQTVSDPGSVLPRDEMESVPQWTMRAILAAVLPAHAVTVLRDATAQQCEDMVAQIAADMMTARLADLERDIRAKVADEIEAVDTDPFSEREAGLVIAAQIARGDR